MEPEAILAALAHDRTIDITTTGAKSGRPQRIETWSWVADGAVYLTGSPGRRGWYANLKANDEFTFHIKRGAQADLPARARAIKDSAERREVLTRLLGGKNDLEAWIAGSPLVEVELLA